MDVLYLRRYGIERIHADRHGQRVSVTVVDIAAHRRDVNTPLLLAGCFLREIAVADHLEPDQADADHHEPKGQESGKVIEAALRVGRFHESIQPSAISIQLRNSLASQKRL